MAGLPGGGSTQTVVTLGVGQRRRRYLSHAPPVNKIETRMHKRFVSLKTAVRHGVSSKSYRHIARIPAVQQALSSA